MKDPYEGIVFEDRLAKLTNSKGEVVFEKIVQFPNWFSDVQVNVVASRYLCNKAKKEEISLRQMIDRVSDTITEFAKPYFDTEEKLNEFNYKLKYYQIHQFFAFNSPVYFNVGLTDKPQTSACFILKLEDNMDSITDWVKHESIIFKHGSGSGVNLSPLRSSKERVRGGGFASGPVSFLKISDVAASVIKSGGTLRRAAKLACLNIDHPDIYKFITCKDKEEYKLQLFKQVGLEPELGYELSDEVFYQNVNISVRVSDNFMQAVENDQDWNLYKVTTGEVVETIPAKKLLMDIAEHAWKTGDPGIMYDDTTNRWNPCISDGRINSSNPCGEFVWLDGGSCNLASVNFKKFFDKDGVFNYSLFQDVVQTVITAQESLINNSFYPVQYIEDTTKKYRPLGLGYSNLGATLMSLGIPYDSDEGRYLAALFTALLTGEAYKTSIEIKNKIGSAQWHTTDNIKGWKRVRDLHIEEVENLLDGIDEEDSILSPLASYVGKTWKWILDSDDIPMNAQVTLLAPTGTISFLMGCDTTGIEPDFALVKYKKLAGSDTMLNYVNSSFREGLQKLGYSDEDINQIEYQLLKECKPLEGIDLIKSEHLSVFDTAIPTNDGSRYIHPMGHLRMIAAVQPFLSMSISKTINLPSDTTVEDIFDIYLKAWKMGLKSVTIYRDKSKTDQVLYASLDRDKETKSTSLDEVNVVVSTRRPMPTDRCGITHKFTINGMLTGYLTANVYEDGRLGEFFVQIAKDGSTIAGLIDAWATMSSVGLQYGVPLKVFVDKMINRRFEPQGFTQNEHVRICSSIVDYIARYLALRFLDDEELEELGLLPPNLEDSNSESVKKLDTNKLKALPFGSGICPECGSLLRKLGTCEFCDQCGFNGGSCG